MSKRLFIAIPLPDSLKDSLSEFSARLQRQGVSGRFVSRENLHITLIFLGAQSVEHMEQIESIFSRSVFDPVDLHVEGTGFFGSLLYAKVQPDKTVENYVCRLRKSLTEAGIQIDPRDLNLHITLARKTKIPDSRALKLSSSSFVAERCILYQSIPQRDGPVYVELEKSSVPGEKKQKNRESGGNPA